MEIITGYTGKPHVTAEQDRDVNEGIFDTGSFVLKTGSQLAAELVSNNEIKVRDGVLVIQGCTAVIKKNTYDPVTIANGSQGMKRIDLIVARYNKNEETKIEEVMLKVIQGTPNASTAAVPTYKTGDIQSGDLVADMPLYKVTLDGLNVTSVDKMFTVIPTLPELSSKLTNTNTKLYETYVDPSTKSICIRFPINRIQICAGTIRVYASLQQNGTGYTGVSTKIEQSTFPKPFKILRGCTITQNSDDWVMILGKTTTLNGISQLRLGYFTAYTNKAFYMDYIAIGTY
mgnify:CR=1 FL=1|jgi:hypothetical protein